MRKNITWLISASLLSGCATTRFSPPHVDLTQHFTSGVPTAEEKTISQASALIDRYLIEYRKAQGQLANGRAYFEIPAILSLAGGVTAAAFGAGPNAAIGTGTASALFSSGNSYFAPKGKARIVSAALNAIVCVKLASVGSSAFDLETNAQKLSSYGITKSDAVSLSATHQYFDLIWGALATIESILGERLSSSGSYSPDALISELNDIAERARKNDTDKDKPDNAEGQGYVMSIQEKHLNDVSVELARLKTDLEKCIIRSKI